MPSTYTTNLGIEKIGTGEQSGTWGTTTNTNLDLIDQAVNGVVQVTLAAAGTSGSPNSLPINDGSASDGRNKFIEFTDGGDLGATAYVQLTPNDAEKVAFFRNSLTGGRSVIIFQGTYNASNDFEIPSGADVVLKFDGAGAGATVTQVFEDLTISAVTLSSGVTASSILDEDNMASDSDTALATQQSIKAYVDSQVGTVDTLAEILANGNTTGGNDILFADNDKAVFGAGSDLQIYHDGSDSYITHTTGGNFFINDDGAGYLMMKGSDLYFRNPSNVDMLHAQSGGFVKLYHNGVAKLATTATGIDVTGNMESDSVTIGVGAVAGTEKLRVNGTVLTLGGTNSVPAIGIGDVNTGIYAPTAGTLGWTINGTQRLLLNDTGIDVTGTVTADGLVSVVSSSGVTTTSASFFNNGAGANTKTGIDFYAASSKYATIAGGFGAAAAEVDILVGSGTQLKVATFSGGGDVRFYENTGTTAKFFWDASAESLGIGTSSPVNLLHLVKPAPASVPAAGASGHALAVGTNPYGLAAGTLSSGTSYLQSTRWDGTATNYNLLLQPNGANVGIGTSSPFAKLHVQSNTGAVGFNHGTTSSPSRGNLWYDTDGSGWKFDIGKVQSGSFTSQVTIQDNGNVGIGTSSPASALDVVGTVTADGLTVQSATAPCRLTQLNSASGEFDRFYLGASIVGSITGSGSTTSYNTTSDERLKENITDAPAGNIDDIKVRSFDWKVDGSHQDYGMVAQELEAVAPYAVTKGETEDDMWSVDYSKLVPMLIKEIQDLKAEVAAIKGAN
jgi:hypothetical protein